MANNIFTAMTISRTFLSHLYLKNKFLFYVVLLYLSVCLITILKSFQISPFYNWSMYSGAVTQPDEYSFTELYCDSSLLSQPHTYNDYQRLMITYSSHEYLKLIDANHETPTYDNLNSKLTQIGLNGQYVADKLTVTDSMIKTYPYWLNRYVRKNTLAEYNTLRFYKITVRYDKNANIELLDRQLIFTQ